MVRSTIGGAVFLSYHSPHKFRHGHAVYALKLAKNIAELKAVSQNLMYANISTTDGIYGILSETDVREQIEGLGANNNVTDSNDFEELKTLAKIIIEKLGN
jgi:site-specific recombinase XerD